VAKIVYEVNNLEEGDLVFFRRFAISRIDELFEESRVAVKKSAELVANMISDSDCLATCSYSSTICETLRLAKLQGKDFKVYVAESRSVDNKFEYGQILAEFLESLKIRTEVFSDGEIGRFVQKTKFVLVGADSVFCDGSIINGAPTHRVAVKAKEFGIPFYSVCETIKVNALRFFGKNTELKEGFDFIQSDLISGIITEKGILDVDTIVKIMEEKSKFFEIF
jgi:translation initiation factor eIF-2B subunit delta